MTSPPPSFCLPVIRPLPSIVVVLLVNVLAIELKKYSDNVDLVVHIFLVAVEGQCDE